MSMKSIIQRPPFFIRPVFDLNMTGGKMKFSEMERQSIIKFILSTRNILFAAQSFQSFLYTTSSLHLAKVSYTSVYYFSQHQIQFKYNFIRSYVYRWGFHVSSSCRSYNSILGVCNNGQPNRQQQTVSDALRYLRIPSIPVTLARCG